MKWSNPVPRPPVQNSIAIIIQKFSWKFYIRIKGSCNRLSNSWNKSDQKYYFHIFYYSLLLLSQNDSNVLFQWKLFILCYLRNIHPSENGTFDLTYHGISNHVGHIMDHYHIFRFCCLEFIKHEPDHMS